MVDMSWVARERAHW